jgi:hypothetical protein
MLAGQFGMLSAGRVWHRIAQNSRRTAQHAMCAAQQNATLSPSKRLWERDRGWHGAAYLELCYAPRNLTQRLPSH